MSRIRREWQSLALGLMAAFALLAAGQPEPAAAQVPAKPRVGWLAPARVPADIETFRHRFRELGWVETENVTIEERYAEGQADRYAELTSDLIRARVDVIVATSTGIATVVQKATRSIPVVFVAGRDPVAMGLVAGLARPGGNLTGVASMSAELGLKMLEVLREFSPVTRVGVFYQPISTQHRSLMDLGRAARALSIQLVPVEISGAGDIDRTAGMLTRERVDGIMPLSSPFFHAEKQRFVSLAAKLRIPAVYEHRAFAEAGGLMSYGMDLREVYGRIAAQVDRILKGARPGDIPVEQPTKLELVINARTAKALGLAIPQSLLTRTDEVIQ